MEEKRQSQHGLWSSRTTFIFAGATATIGLGNIWKFPYMTGQNGGGIFVIMYLGCVLLIGIPLMLSEIMLGRFGRRNPADTFREIARDTKHSRHWQWLGAMMIIAGSLILTYYCVIAGWALAYFFKSLFGEFSHVNADAAKSIFDTLVANPLRLSLWHTLVLMMTITVIAFGLEKGIERVIKYMFPSLLILLGLLIAFGITTGGFKQAVIFLFEPDFTEIKRESILMAMGQAFFSLSIATGSMTMYGAYVPRNVSIVSSAILIALLDTAIALLAGLAIFPIVFANGLSPAAGSGLIFEVLPIAFGQMPCGGLFAVLFFLMLVFAAFTSTISLLEPPVVWLVERYRISRPRAAIILGTLIWLLGFITIFSFNKWKEIKLFGLNLFEFIDFVTANIMLPLGGLMIAIFIGWVLQRKVTREQLQVEDKLLFRSWRFIIRFVTPILIIIVFLESLGII